VSAAGIELELLVGGDRLIDIGLNLSISSDTYEPTDRSIDQSTALYLSISTA